MTHQCNRHNRGGFTLIELALGSAILIVALCGLLLLFNYCYTLCMEAGNMTDAAAETYGRLDQIRAENYNNIMTNFNGTQFNLDHLNGNGVSNIVYATADNELLWATVNINWTEKGNRVRNLSLTSFVASR